MSRSRTGCKVRAGPCKGAKLCARARPLGQGEGLTTGRPPGVTGYCFMPSSILIGAGQGVNAPIKGNVLAITVPVKPTRAHDW